MIKPGEGRCCLAGNMLGLQHRYQLVKLKEEAK